MISVIYYVALIQARESSHQSPEPSEGYELT